MAIWPDPCASPEPNDAGQRRPSDQAPGHADAQSAALAAMILRAFPDLHLGDCRLEKSGGDHLLLIADDRLVFRFPRDGMHDLALEIAVLRRLQPLSPIATPDYRYVDPAGRFAGYDLLQGSALTPARFAALSHSARNDVLAAMAAFLKALHGLPADAIAPLDQWRRFWTPADYAGRALTEFLPGMARCLPHQAPAIKAFYGWYHEVLTPRRVVLHGDLVDEHMLYDEQTGRLSGVIDFSDVALGDPAQDFFGFWAYGADVAGALVALYDPAATDPGLVVRSHAHFIRYRLGRILEEAGSDTFDPAHAAAQIDVLLAGFAPQ